MPLVQYSRPGVDRIRAILEILAKIENMFFIFCLYSTYLRMTTFIGLLKGWYPQIIDFYGISWDFP